VGAAVTVDPCDWAHLASVAKHAPEELEPHDVRWALLQADELRSWVNSRRSIHIETTGDSERVTLVLDVERGMTGSLFAAGVLE